MFPLQTCGKALSLLRNSKLCCKKAAKNTFMLLYHDFFARLVESCYLSYLYCTCIEMKKVWDCAITLQFWKSGPADEEYAEAIYQHKPYNAAKI